MLPFHINSNALVYRSGKPGQALDGKLSLASRCVDIVLGKIGILAKWYREWGVARPIVRNSHSIAAIFRESLAIASRLDMIADYRSRCSRKDRPIMRLLTYLVFSFAALGSWQIPATAQEPKKPNVIFVLIDDMG